MKYICLGYVDPNKFASASEAEMHAMIDSCCAYDDELRANGHFKGGEGLQPSGAATTVQVRDGETITSDGPFAETREQLGGYYLLECRDLDEAIGWATRVPGVGAGAIEVRPVMNYAEVAS